jgi:hypothetical protein
MIHMWFGRTYANSVKMSKQYLGTGRREDFVMVWEYKTPSASTYTTFDAWLDIVRYFPYGVDFEY